MTLSGTPYSFPASRGGQSIRDRDVSSYHPSQDSVQVTTSADPYRHITGVRIIKNFRPSTVWLASDEKNE
jgi:hypothetical protein